MVKFLYAKVANRRHYKSETIHTGTYAPAQHMAPSLNKPLYIERLLTKFLTSETELDAERCLPRESPAPRVPGHQSRGAKRCTPCRCLIHHRLVPLFVAARSLKATPAANPVRKIGLHG